MTQQVAMMSMTGPTTILSGHQTILIGTGLGLAELLVILSLTKAVTINNNYKLHLIL